MRPFGEILKEHLKRADISPIDFADQIGVGKSFISKLINDQTTMPLDRVDQFARRLDLSGETRREFELAAALTHAPQLVCEEMARLEKQRSRAAEPSAGYDAGEAERLRAENAQLRAEVEKLTAGLDQVEALAARLRAALGQRQDPPVRPAEEA